MSEEKDEEERLRLLKYEKSIIHSLLTSAPCKEMDLNDLERDYRETIGSAIPYKRLGFKNVIDLLYNISDSVVVKRNRDGRYIVSPTSKPETKDVRRLVLGQKPKKRRVRSGTYHQPRPMRAMARQPRNLAPRYNNVQVPRYNVQAPRYNGQAPRHNVHEPRHNVHVQRTAAPFTNRRPPSVQAKPQPTPHAPKEVVINERPTNECIQSLRNLSVSDTQRAVKERIVSILANQKDDLTIADLRSFYQQKYNQQLNIKRTFWINVQEFVEQQLSDIALLRTDDDGALCLRLINPKSNTGPSFPESVATVDEDDEKEAQLSPVSSALIPSTSIVNVSSSKSAQSVPKKNCSFGIRRSGRTKKVPRNESEQKELSGEVLNLLKDYPRGLEIDKLGDIYSQRYQTTFDIEKQVGKSWHFWLKTDPTITDYINIIHDRPNKRGFVVYLNDDSEPNSSVSESVEIASDKSEAESKVDSVIAERQVKNCDGDLRVTFSSNVNDENQEKVLPDSQPERLLIQYLYEKSGKEPVGLNEIRNHSVLSYEQILDVLCVKHKNDFQLNWDGKEAYVQVRYDSIYKQIL